MCITYFISFVEKGWKIWFLTLVGLTLVKGTTVRKKDTENDEQGETAQRLLEPFLIKMFQRFSFFTHQKNDHPTRWNSMPKVFQNGAIINATTHQKSMPTLVTEKIT